MNAPVSPEDPRNPVGDSSSVESAISEASMLVEERIRAMEEAGGQPPDRTGSKVAVAAVLAAVSAWVWVSPPSFVLPEPLPQPTVEELDAGDRLALVGIAVDIMRIQEESGALPEALTELDVVGDEFAYARVADTLFSLSWVTESGPRTWRSDEPLDDLVGDAFDRVAGGGQ